MRNPCLALLALQLAGCSDSSPVTDGPPRVDLPRADLLAADRGTADTQKPLEKRVTDLRLADGNPCARLPAAADRARKVVVAHPYDAAGKKVGNFEVLDLSQDGKLGKSGDTFQLGAAGLYGDILFTPDGKIGLLALDDGTVGVFSLDGKPKVIHAGFKATAYIDRLVLEPDGEHVLALSGQWRNNGGGLYRLRVQCDGTLVDEGMVTASKLPAALVWVPSQGASRAALVATDVLASTAGDQAFLLDVSPTPTLVAGAAPFPDSDAIVSSAALTSDEKYLLIADNNIFAGGNRVAAVEVQQGKLRAAQVLGSLKDPAAVVTSPWGDTALVIDCEANAITILDYHPASASAPFTVRGALTTSSKPQLPSAAVMIRRGTLSGRVLVSELSSVRQVQLTQGGVVSEVELLGLGNGSTSICGSIGVQP